MKFTFPFSVSILLSLFIGMLNQSDETLFIPDETQLSAPHNAKAAAPASVHRPGPFINQPHEPAAPLTQGTAALLAPTITAIKIAALVTDNGTAGPTPTDVIEYTVTIANSGPDDATGVNFTDTVDPNTTLVPGSVKSAPIAVKDAYSTVGNVSISVPATSGLTTNDVNLDGDVLNVTAVDQTGTEGQVTFNANGSFTFNPNPGFTGTTTFTYTVNDGTFNSTGTVTITITGMIWFINASAGGGGDGRLNTPFNSIADFNAGAADDPNDNIFLYTGSYSSNLTLLNGQNLIGQGATTGTLAALAGVTFSVHPPISGSIPTTGGTNPTISTAVTTLTVAQNNDLLGVTINNTGGTALSGTSLGTLKVRDVIISNTNGTAVSLSNGILDAIFKSISASNASHGLRLQSTTGSFEITGTGTNDGSGGTINNISQRGIELITATNITLRNLTLNNANTADAGFDGVCDEDQNTSCYAAIHMSAVTGTNVFNNVDITTTEEHGINGNNVTNLSLTNCTVTGAGDENEENGVKFIDLTGACSFTGCTFSNSGSRNTHIRTGSGTLNLTVNNCSFSNTNYLVTRFDCFEMRTLSSATATVNITSSTFYRAGSKGIQALAEGSSTFTFNLTNCSVQRFGNPMAGIETGSVGTATMNFNINNNTAIESSAEVAVLTSTFNTSIINGRVNNNTSIANTPASASTFSNIRVLHEGNGTAKVEVKDNPSVTSTNLDIPVLGLTRIGSMAAARLDLTLDGNNITDNTAGLEGIEMRVGVSTMGTTINTLCGNVRENFVTVPNGNRAFRARILEPNSFMALQGVGPDVNTNWNGVGGNANTNSMGSTVVSFAQAPAAITFNATCLTPGHAPAPVRIAAEPLTVIEKDRPEDEVAQVQEEVKSEPDTLTTIPGPSKETNEVEEAARRAVVLAGETVTVGSPGGFLLPAGQNIIIKFQVTINNPLPSLPLGPCQISNQGTVTAAGGINVLTDDTALPGATDPTTTTLSTHTLGNLVYKDNNKNNTFDGGDMGIAGVTVNLYSDVNGNGVLDAGDGSAIATSTTGDGGVYAFPNLCSGEYIVQIPSAEFGSGQELNGLISSPGGPASDPDNNTDNDDNGQDAINSSIASQAITLNFSGATVEVNNSLDFGFRTPTLVTINDVTLNEGSGGGTTGFTFTVSRDNVSDAFSLDVNTAVISPNNGDYTAISGGTVSFTAGGNPTASVTVTVNADDVVELNETFNVLLSGATYGIIISDGTALGTIMNDDQATLSINSVSNAEGNSGIEPYTFTVTSDKAVDVPFTVNVGAVDGTATTADGDYVANSTTLNFVGTAGETKTFLLIVNRDMKVEPTETFTVPLSTVSASGRNVVISGPSGTGTGTITNDDEATISITDVSQDEGNLGTTNFVFNVTLSHVVSTAVTVNFTTADGTATLANTDYNTNSNSITFPANGTGQTQTITVQVIGDLVGEANETFNVNLTSIQGNPPNISFADAQGLGTILDDDLSFSINDVTLDEGNTGTTNFTFTVTRTSTATAETIQYATANNTAVTGDNDYVSSSGTLNFAIGDNSETITVVVNGDNKVELNETFFVNLSNPSNGSIGDGQGIGTLTNDDQATLTVNSLSKTEGDAGSQNYDFTVTLNKEIDVAISVDVTTSNILATSGSGDFVANSATLNFAGTAGETKTFTVVVNGDMIVEPDENFGVILSNLLANSRSVTLGAPSNGTILNDDAATISIDDVTKVEGDAGTTDFEFSVTLSKVVSTAVSFDFTTAGISATSGVDFAPNSNTITFPANGAGQTQTITVPVIGDVLGEANETFTVDLSNIIASPSVTFADAQGLGTIEDDDLAFSINDVSIAEGNAGTTNLVFTVTRTSIATAETIDFTTANNTATTADNDYVLNSGTLNFAMGDDTETITVVLNGNTKVELNETFFVNLSNASNGAISDAQGVGTITNDDQATLTIDNVSKTEGDAGTQTYTFTVSVDNAVDVPYTVNVGTVDGTATAGTDYVANSTTLNFAGTAGESHTFEVTVNGDMLVEPTEIFTVPLSTISASGRDVVISGPLGTGTGTITNDDAATISIDNVTLAEGDAGTVNFVFNVTLSKVVSTAVSVDFATANGTAGAGDYNSNSGTVTFPANGAGQTQTITIQVIGDVLGEANETFNVNLSNIVGSANVTFADAQGLGTILDDDLAFSINDVTVAEGAGTTNMTFTVTRTSIATAETIQYATANNTATTGDNDYTSTSGTLTFAIGDDTETFTVVINGDNKVELNETFFVNLSNASNGNIADAQGEGTITNDDNATVTLTSISATQNEGTGAGTTGFQFRATLNNPVQGGFTVAYTNEDGTATIADGDYNNNDGTITFTGTANEQHDIIVQVNRDSKVEANETFTVTLGTITGAPAGVTAEGSPQLGTINNDDAAIVSIAANVSQFEATTPQTFSVTLSNPVDVPVTVQFTTADNTATTGDIDYTAVNQTVTFTANTTTAQSVNVPVSNDNKVEDNEVFNVTIGTLAASGRSVSLGTATATGTIQNDDLASVTLSIVGLASQNEGNTGNTPFTFRATLNNPVQNGFTLAFLTNDITATAGSDYTDNDNSLTFAGTASEFHDITVNALGELVIENDETFTVTLGAISGTTTVQIAAIGTADSPQTATIINDELDWGDAPNTYLTLLTSNGPRHATIPNGLRLGASIDADLDGQPNANATGDGADEDGVTLPPVLVLNTTTNLTVNASATGKLDAWVDFNNNGSFADAGEKVFDNVAVAAGNNALSFAVPSGAIPSNTFSRFRLSTVGGLAPTGLAADGEVEDYAVQIVNTQFSINDPTVTEGNDGTANLTFTVSRSINENECSVAFTLSGGTATSGTDYHLFTNGTLNFAAGGAFSQTVTVVVNGDNTVELDETILMTLSNATNASILDGSGTGTIQNDDAALITVSNPTIAEGSTGTSAMTFTIALSQPSDAALTVNYTTVDATATTADNDYQNTSGTLTFAPGETSKTVSVTINGDCNVEPNETLLLRLSSLNANGRAVTLSGGGATLDATGTIINTPRPTATISGTIALCQGAPAPVVTFIGSGGTGPYTFFYQVNGGATQSITTLSGSSATVSHSTASGGIFTYTLLSVSDVNCLQNLSDEIVITVYSLPTDVALSGGGISFCGTPMSILVESSQAGVSYQLKRNNVNLGSPLSGTGSSLPFSGLTQAGTYSVVATTLVGGCSRTLSEQITIQTRNAPTAYNLTGGGASCSGTPVSINLSNSQIGVLYQLKRANNPVGSPIPGTGNALAFPPQNTAGNYSAVALTQCADLTMNNTVSVTSVITPNTYTVTGGGNSCGTALPVGLSDSQSGVFYQLLRNNTPVGTTVQGTGQPIALGNHLTQGQYTILATRAGECPTPMSGSVFINLIDPPALFNVSGGGAACPGGVPISLSGSQSGINYQLKRGTTLISEQQGDGSPLFFGNQTVAGNYTVEAVSILPGNCTRTMSGTAIVTSAGTLPNLYSMTGGGPLCNTTTLALGLSDSQRNIYYQLQRNTPSGFVNVGTSVQGTGNALSLGSHSVIGEYRVVVNSACLTEMANRTSITACPSREASEPFTVGSLAGASVSPNPVSNILHLKISEAKGQQVNVSLLDAAGRLMLQRAFVPESNQHQEEFEVSNLSNGMYFLRVITADKQTTLKVVKVE